MATVGEMLGGSYSSMFITNWFLLLFYDTLPFPLMLRVWDLYFLKGAAILYGAGLALLEEIEPKLMKLTEFSEIVLAIKGAQRLSIDYPEFLIRLIKYGVKDHHIDSD